MLSSRIFFINSCVLNLIIYFVSNPITAGMLSGVGGGGGGIMNSP